VLFFDSNENDPLKFEPSTEYTTEAIENLKIEDLQNEETLEEIMFPEEKVFTNKKAQKETFESVKNNAELGKMNHLCTFCKHIFKNIADLKIHIKRHKNVLPMATMVSREKAEVHIAVEEQLEENDPNKKLKCVYKDCSFETYVPGGLKYHISSHKDCHICGKSFATDKRNKKSKKRHFQNHMKKHELLRKLESEGLNENNKLTMSTPTKLLQNLLDKNDPVNRKKTTCQFCLKDCKYKSVLEKHQETCKMKNAKRKKWKKQFTAKKAKNEIKKPSSPFKKEEIDESSELKPKKISPSIFNEDGYNERKLIVKKGETTLIIKGKESDTSKNTAKITVVKLRT